MTKPALAPILDASPDLVDRFAAVLKTAPGRPRPGLLRPARALLDRAGFASLIRGFFAGRHLAEARGADGAEAVEPHLGRDFGRPCEQTADPPLLLVAVVQDDVGQAVVEEGIAEPVDDGGAVGRRLGDARRREDRQDLLVVERVEPGADLGVGDQLADGLVLAAAVGQPALGEAGVRRG